MEKNGFNDTQAVLNKDNEMIIDLSVIKSACATLKSFLKQSNTEQEKAGIVQAFEFCFELSWKTLKKVLYNEGIKANSPKEAFREAGALELISNVRLWFGFTDIRNKTVHTYNKLILEEIIKEVPAFYEALEKLITALDVRVLDINNKISDK